MNFTLMGGDAQKMTILNIGAITFAAYGTYKIFKLGPQQNTLSKCVGLSVLWGSMLSSAWNLVTKRNITDTTAGFAALVAVESLPLTAYGLTELNNTRRVRLDSEDDVFGLIGIAAATTANAATVALLNENSTQESDLGAVALASCATFTPALSFFTYESMDRSHFQTLLKAASASIVAAEVVSLALASRPRATA